MSPPMKNVREPSQRLASKTKKRWGKPTPRVSAAKDASALRRCNNPWGRKGKPLSVNADQSASSVEGRPPIVIRIRTSGSVPVILPLREIGGSAGQGEKALSERKRAWKQMGPGEVFPGKRARVECPPSNRPTLVARRGGYTNAYSGVKALEVSGGDFIHSPSALPSTSHAPKKLCLQRWKEERKSELLKTQDSSSGFSEIDTSAETEVEDSDSGDPCSPLVMDLSSSSQEGRAMSANEDDEEVVITGVKIDNPVWHYSSAYVPPPINTLANPFLRSLGDTTPRPSVISPGGPTTSEVRVKAVKPSPQKNVLPSGGCARMLPLSALKLTRDLLPGPSKPQTAVVRDPLPEPSQPKVKAPSSKGVLSAARSRHRMPALSRNPAYLAGYKAALSQGGINPSLKPDGSLDVVVDAKPFKPPVLADVQSAYNGITNLGFLTDQRPRGLKENVIRRRIVAALEAKTHDVFISPTADPLPQISIPEPSGSAEPFGPMRATVSKFNSPPSLPMVDGQLAQTRVKFQLTANSKRMTADTAKSVTTEVPSSSRVDSALLPVAHSTDPGRVLLSPNLDLLPIHQRVKTSGATLQLQTQIGSTKLPMGRNMKNPKMEFTSPSQYQAWLGRTTWETQDDSFLAVSILIQSSFTESKIVLILTYLILLDSFDFSRCNGLTDDTSSGSRGGSGVAVPLPDHQSLHRKGSE